MWVAPVRVHCMVGREMIDVAGQPKRQLLAVIVDFARASLSRLAGGWRPLHFSIAGQLKRQLPAVIFDFARDNLSGLACGRRPLRIH